MTKTLLQINPVARQNTSTGRIMREIGNRALDKGWRSVLAYSGGRDALDPACRSELMPVGGKLNVGWHAFMTRVFDRHGLASRIATRRFLKQMDELRPDVVQIHNIHGYFLNYRMLFGYLAKRGIPVVWTVHDCWLYTGHCYHYASVGCDRWKTGCHDCPQKKSFPASWLFDRSRKNWIDKKSAFTSLPNMTIVTVSEWMKGEMKDSFLKDCSYRVIHNGIDCDAFKPCDTDNVRKKYGIDTPRAVLAIASIWLKEKGFDDLMRLADMMGEDETLLMVGRMTPGQQAEAGRHDRIKLIPRTDNVGELAALYTLSNVLVNPTWQDNYPTVNMESTACGTPVITYRTGGSVESISQQSGLVVEQGDVDAMRAGILEIYGLGKDHFTAPCREFALANFRKEDRYEDYFELYETLMP